ncbi:MAG: helix-turn-helix domain-containing protein, partial [Xanthomonadales bacterium]|nr:helix-turn-helix domain-containing protein [Xanthomonadales bacterium]
MNNESGYTLEELAETFDLTPRTARHYLENVLPAHHKQGRGKLAFYGQDTWNCFAFIQKARSEKLTASQISRVLADLSQAQINRVAQGEEELTIVPTSAIESSGVYLSDRMAR